MVVAFTTLDKETSLWSTTLDSVYVATNTFPKWQLRGHNCGEDLVSDLQSTKYLKTITNYLSRTEATHKASSQLNGSWTLQAQAYHLRSFMQTLQDIISLEYRNFLFLVNQVFIYLPNSAAFEILSG